MGVLLCERTASASQAARNLIARFLRNVQQTSSTVVSFNWDLVLECAALKRAAHYKSIPVEYDDFNKAAVQMAKPHGSLNLAELDAEEYYGSNGTPKYSDVKVVRGDRTTKKMVVRADNPANAKRSIVNQVRTSDKVLVEPTARKEYSSDWIRRQWHRAFHMIRCADEIVIIGYSLPDTDLRPRILFQTANWDTENQPRIVLIDPDADRVVERYQRFVRVAIDPIALEWKDWFEQTCNGNPM